MLNKVISFSIENKLIIAIMIFVLIGWGSYEVSRLPIDAVPDITDNQIQVITVSPALGATDVERLITFPVEQSCSNVPGLRNMRSFSRFGLSLVTIVFRDDVDIYWARQQINERLQQVAQSLPSGIGTPEMAPVTTGLGEIYQYVVRAKEGYEHRYSTMDLRTLQDWVVRRQLLGTPGVADVSSFGGHLKQYEIALRMEQLKMYNITIPDIFLALEHNNENTGGAYIEKGPRVLFIRTEGLAKGISDIESIVVKRLSNGLPLLMRDVANVRLGHAVRYGAMTYNDKGEVAGAVVMMLKGENSSTVIKKVKDKIADIQRTLPEGIVIEPFLDRTKMVNNAITTVKTNLIEGALIVVFVLVFFLASIRAGLIVSSVIPLSMLFAVILMNRFRVEGNLMSLGAIDFGLIVDGSVIVVEAILHRFYHARQFTSMNRLTQHQMDNEVRQSTGSMIKSAAFSQVIILIVYIPILALEGIEGKMFKPMAYTVSFAILGAFILSVTYVPMMSSIFLSKKIDHKPSVADRLMAWIQKQYEPALNYVLSVPTRILAITMVLFFSSVVLLMSMGGEFIPELEEGDFAVDMRLLTGSSLSSTVNTARKAAGILTERFPEVEKVVTKIGSSEIPVDPMPLEASDMMVILKDKDQWTSASTFDELADKMDQALSEVPGVSIGFQYPVQMRFNELMTGARQDVVCKIFGEDLDTLSFYSHALGKLVNEVEGTADLYVERVTGMPQVVIAYDRHAMAMYGLTVREVNNTVNAAFAGQMAGSVYEGERRFDLVVRLEKGARNSVSDIENLLIPVNNDLQIPLYQVADIEEVVGPNQIQRENTRRRIVVGFNVSGRDVQSIVRELQQKVEEQLDLPQGYNITYGGAFENLTSARQRLLIVVPVALSLIFLLLYFAFRSIKLGLLVYSAIPLSAMGGIFSLWLRGMPFSISAGVGFVALFGVAVLNGILLVSEFTRLKEREQESTHQVVIKATKNKLRALLMTALVPSLGFIPMALSQGAGAEVQKPLATVVIGGLVVSTMLTLFVLPVLYCITERKRHIRLETAAKGVLLLMGIAGTSMGYAQHKINVHEAVDIALRNNAELNVSRLRTDYFEKLKKSSFDPEQATASFEYGQMNGPVNDTKFSISQALRFPNVYRQQHNVNTSNVQISKAATKMNESQLKADVKRRFYELLICQKRISLLRTADSLYTEFLKRMKRRYELGDIDALEISAAGNQQHQIHYQLASILTEYQVRLHEFQVVLNLNIDDSIQLQSDHIKYPLMVYDTTLHHSPAVEMAYAYTSLRTNELKLEKSKLAPDIMIGYSNLSFIGFQQTGSGEKYFSANDRFSYFTFGLGIPVFSAAQRSRIQAYKVYVHLQQEEAVYSERKVKAMFKDQWRMYLEMISQVAAYEETLLKNVETIISTATNRLLRGEVGYLEWIILVNQSIETRTYYLDLVQRTNELAFKIEELKGE